MNSFESVEELYQLFSSDTYYFVQLLGWEDGTYFVQLCNEDGGVIANHLSLFARLKKTKKMIGHDLEKLLTEANNIPFFHSGNKNYELNYDIHIWSRNQLFVINLRLKKIIIKKLNLFQRILGLGILPDWQQ
jgi:hypothetical protein